MLFDVDADDRPLDPRALDKRLDRGLAAAELMLVAVFGQKLEAGEIAETVVDDCDDLTSCSRRSRCP
jgi:hypothetical protein